MEIVVQTRRNGKVWHGEAAKRVRCAVQSNLEFILRKHMFKALRGNITVPSLKRT